MVVGDRARGVRGHTLQDHPPTVAGPVPAIAQFPVGGQHRLAHPPQAADVRALQPVQIQQPLDRILEGEYTEGPVVCRDAVLIVGHQPLLEKPCRTSCTGPTPAGPGWATAPATGRRPGAATGCRRATRLGWNAWKANRSGCGCGPAM